MAILQIHSQGPWQHSFVTRYHLKIISICSGFCSGAFRQSEISFTARRERERPNICLRATVTMHQPSPAEHSQKFGPLKSNGLPPLIFLHLHLSVKLSPPGDGWEPPQKKVEQLGSLQPDVPHQHRREEHLL